jgi:hypothetical protein
MNKIYVFILPPIDLVKVSKESAFQRYRFCLSGTHYKQDKPPEWLNFGTAPVVNHYELTADKPYTVYFRLLVMDTSMHTQKPCTIELNHIVYMPTTLMASVYLSFLPDKQPEIHCIATIGQTPLLFPSATDILSRKKDTISTRHSMET